MEFRHEIKHEISALDACVLRSRLLAALEPDCNGENGKYEIRSLYFDNLYDTALQEKVNGVNQREKFRIRAYNGDMDFIRLEKKSKINGLCSKESAKLTADEVEQLLQGDIAFLHTSERPLLQELSHKMQTKGLVPKTLVDYTREAFTYPWGNVRITLDSEIRTGLHSTDFLDADSVTVPAGDVACILEVKWDAYLPDHIRNLLQLSGRRASAYSKYATCRIYG